jgi:hypothetical protein
MKPEYAEDYNSRGYAYYKLGGTRDNFINAIVNYDLAIALGKADYKPGYEYRQMASLAARGLITSGK